LFDANLPTTKEIVMTIDFFGKKYEGVPVVIWAFIQRFLQLHTGLVSADDEVRVACLRHLVELTGHDRHSFSRVMFSLSENVYDMGGSQFRCWDGPFGLVSLNHVDSGGHDLLFDCRGSKEEMDELVSSLDCLKRMRKWQEADYVYERGRRPVYVWLGWR
jgi:hypothetical protein